MKKIIWFVWEIGCGKWAAIDYLSAKYNAVSYRYSAILRWILSSLYIPVTRENLQNLSTILRQNFWENVFAKVLAENINKSSEQIIVIDWIRRSEDMEYIKDLKWFTLIYVESNIEKRYNRTKNRWENIDELNLSLEQFMKNSKAETELKIKELKNVANYIIKNDESLELLYKEIDKIMQN